VKWQVGDGDRCCCENRLNCCEMREVNDDSNNNNNNNNNMCIETTICFLVYLMTVSNCTDCVTDRKRNLLMPACEVTVEPGTLEYTARALITS
jgi:hypothetical protein